MSATPYDPLAPSRRSDEITIGGRVYQVREPDPVAAYQVILAVTPLLGPWLTKVLSGSLTVLRPALCPACGSTKAEQINGQRWLCSGEIDAAGQEPRPCRNIWPREVEVDERGRPVIATVGYMLERESGRVHMALEIQQGLERLDPAEGWALTRQILLGNLAVQTMGAWVVIRDEQQMRDYLPSGMAIMRLVLKAAEAWILPQLVDDWTDTSPASPTEPTAGGSPVPAPNKAAHGSRVPPRVKRTG